MLWCYVNCFVCQCTKCRRRSRIQNVVQCNFLAFYVIWFVCGAWPLKQLFVCPPGNSKPSHGHGLSGIKELASSVLGVSGPADDKTKDDNELWCNVEAQTAFLGPNLWDKTYETDLKVFFATIFLYHMSHYNRHEI